MKKMKIWNKKERKQKETTNEEWKISYKNIYKPMDIILTTFTKPLKTYDSIEKKKTTTHTKKTKQ